MRLVMFTTLLMARSIHVFRRCLSFKNLIRLSAQGTFIDNSVVPTNPDILLTGLNAAQDISIKVVSVRDILQELVEIQKLSDTAAQSLGEVLVSTLMMGSTMKGEETLQVNFVGDAGLKNVMVITDSDLKVRGMVGNGDFKYDVIGELTTAPLFGEGQIQVVRNHPSWKAPSNGIVSLRETSIALNLALYMIESEQRLAAIITDVKIENGRCVHALGVMVERLPGATEENVETSIANLVAVDKKRLHSYLEDATDTRKLGNGPSVSAAVSSFANRVLDDCLVGMGSAEDILRWYKSPEYRCSCGQQKVIRAIRLIPKEEVKQILQKHGAVELKCEFCGKKYSFDEEAVTSSIYSF